MTILTEHWIELAVGIVSFVIGWITKHITTK